MKKLQALHDKDANKIVKQDKRQMQLEFKFLNWSGHGIQWHHANSRRALDIQRSLEPSQQRIMKKIVRHHLQGIFQHEQTTGIAKDT